MKKLLLAIGLIFLSTTMSMATELSIIDSLRKLPNVKQGAAFSLADSKLNYLSTIDLLKIKGFNLEGGAAYDAESTGVKAVAVISYDLLKVKDVVNLPILDLIEFRPGIYAGFGRIDIGTDKAMDGNNEFDYGISVSVINLKF